MNIGGSADSYQLYTSATISQQDKATVVSDPRSKDAKKGKLSFVGLFIILALVYMIANGWPMLRLNKKDEALP
jgi:hypothetical protein